MGQVLRHETKSDNGHEAYKNIKLAFFLNLAFTIFEVIGGLWTNSLAILSDALHDLGDSISLGMSWHLEKYSQKAPDKIYTYGYARFSVLSALINNFILVGGSVLILTRAIPRILHPEEVKPGGMLIFAVTGIIINGLAVLRLKKGKSFNEKAVFWHMLEDVVGWLAILAAGVIMLFVDMPVLDPVLSVLITVYVIYNVIKNSKGILRVLMQRVPVNLSIDELEKEIAALPGVLSVHHTHLWSLEGEKNLLSTHVAVKEETGMNEILKIKNSVKEMLHQKNIKHVTVEIDCESESCGDENCI